ncbi:MAG: LysR family transcriptional regulator [Lachnospiraceae bacterium]|nr:LysR family transcriptional regulator [Lachnospiraceae bacterium]
MTGREYVYEVYKAGSFSKAAKALFISQPALSTAVGKVEASLGGKIFNRSTTPLTLTEIVMAYIEATEKINDIEYSLHNRLLELSDLKYGHLNVGGANFFSSCMLPKIIQVFSKKYPGITLEITESDSINLYERAQENHIDLIIDSGVFNKKQFISHLLFTEQILIGIPADNPINDRFQQYQLSYLDIMCHNHLQKQECIPVTELKDQVFILLNKGHDLHARSMKIFEHNHFLPQNVLYLNQLMTAYNLAVAGIGLVFVTDTLVKLATQNELIYYKIDDDAAHRDTFLAHTRNRIPTKAMEKFIETSRTVFPPS